MADYIRPTPRNPFLGGLADLLEASTSPERTQQMQGIMSMLGVPAVASTLNRMSYGAPLTSGAGGLGGTTRILPDVLEAAMTVAPMAPAAGKAAVATGKALGPTAAGMTERYMQRQGLMPSLDVWHGSPHTFPPTARNPLGEFDASKIGTGEGAQAYGIGTYTAEVPATAIEYQKKLSSTGSAKNLARNFGGVDEGLAEAKRRVEHYKQLIAEGGGGAIGRAKSMLQIAEKNVEDLNAMRAGLPENTGNLYKVNLPDEMIPKMLDWDKPLSQQHPDVQAALAGIDIAGAYGMKDSPKKWAEYGFQPPKILPSELISNLANKLSSKPFHGDSAAASEALRQAGIPGIKYLDERSRGPAQIFDVGSPREGFGPYSPYTSMEEAKKQLELLKGYGFKDAEIKVQDQPQTRNFVTFPGEEQNLRILERNGLLNTIAP